MISSRTRSFDRRSSAVCQSVMMQIVSRVVDLGERRVADVEPAAFVEQVGDLVRRPAGSVWRRTSVGWAVITGLTRSSAMTSATSSAGTPASAMRSKRRDEAAGTRRGADDAMVAATSFEMHVLGGVGEQREPVEGADHVELLGRSGGRRAGPRGRRPSLV